MIKRLREWWEYQDGWHWAFITVLILLVISLSVLMVSVVVVDARRQKEFMNECLTERKKYECTAMWRAGESQIISMPVIIGR